MGAITALQRQVQALESELAGVRAEILKHKYIQAGGQAAVLAHSSSHNIQALLLATSGDVSATAAPSPPRPMLPDVRTPASSFNVYPPASSSSTDYSSITNENIPYFLS
ncbi:hypothetical protein KSP39_PZI017819 [Platanthera zijinensis]|uniref:Uncharacterized protein n=1 Tax=Platanthera zijinensis TaxID=2320716 RepID=A0AAP0B6B6_9ASPA